MKLTQVLVLLLCCLVSAGLALFAERTFFAPASAAENAFISSERPDRETLRKQAFIGSTPTSFTDAARQVTPAVVFIRAYPANVSRLEPSVRHTTTGSGVIIAPNGLVATNKHVIEGAVRIRVMLEDKREFDARIVGIDDATDLALLHVDNKKPLPALPFGNSDSLQIGEWVMAVGNPFSLNSTVTAGIVSGKGRSIDVLEPEDRIESFIQTDAAINPGNSGGALVNTAGELVGINTAILTNSGRHEGFAFAIPGNLAQRVLFDLRDFGRVKRAVLGAYVQNVNAAQARKLGLDVASGILITGLRPGSPALRAGLEVDDVLTDLNGVSINSPGELQQQLSRYRPGDKVRVKYVRNGRSRSLNVLLRDKNSSTRKLVRGVE
jgi:serine protease Do